MNTKQFVEKYLGEIVDYDGYFGAQCVDLFRQFNKEVNNNEHTGGVTGAEELYTNHENLVGTVRQKDFYVKIPRTVTPVEGDVAIFGKNSYNRYGHVAIVLWANEKTLVVFEQDGFKQTGTKISTWGYDRVLGYLRSKRDA